MLEELRARCDVEKKKAAFEAGKLPENIEAKKVAAKHGLTLGQVTVEESATGKKATPADANTQWMWAGDMTRKVPVLDFSGNHEVRRLACIAPG